ncbi:MAG: ABC transporter substrate-binding protein [Pseudomonadota bacterium]
MTGPTRVLAAVLAMACLPIAAPAQTVTIVREVETDRYDPHRTTARAASEVLFMLADTLVSLDFDMKTIAPGLAERWEVSEDGLTYTFHLKEGVSFCDGRAMTADDVVYSLNRWIDPETKSPVAWRAGDVKSITAADANTVVYELEAPFSELLYQLTQSFAVVVDQEQVAALGDDFGVTGFNGTGPFCWGEWRPREVTRLTRHEAYTWGPPIYENTGPAQVAEVEWRMVPEENTRMAAVMTGQVDITQYVPWNSLRILRGNPKVQVTLSDAAHWSYFTGFKIDKPVVNETAVRQALNLAVDQEALVRNIYFDEVEPAFSYISTGTLDWNAAIEPDLLTTDIERANAILDGAGWVMGDDGFRYKEGEKLEVLAYGFTGSTWSKIMEAMQADFRKVGADLQIQLYDATVAWGKLATQEFDLFGMSFPYVSAGDALNLYFRSENMPTPNRMNWNDPETDRLLNAGKTATSEAERAEAYGEVLRKVHDAAVWIPLYHEPMRLAQTTRMAPVRPHNIYGCGLYKGLDFAFVE